MSKRVYTISPTQNAVQHLSVRKSGDLGEKQVVRAAGVEPTTSGFGAISNPFDLEFRDLISPL